MAMSKIKKDDTVIVLTGKNKQKTGKVIKRMGDLAYISGINLAKKHVKPNPNAGQEGGIVEKEQPIHISNLAYYNLKTNKADRIGIKSLANGKKARYTKSDGELVDEIKG